MLDRFPSRHLQVVLDPYNYLARAMLPAAERVTRDFLDRFEHRFVLAHLKDVSADGAEAETPEFGTGVFPQRVYVEFLAERRPDLAARSSSTCRSTTSPTRPGACSPPRR